MAEDMALLEHTLVRLEATERDLAALREAVRQTDVLATIGGLAAGLAHELNNLLTPALGYASLAERTPDNRELVSKALRRTIESIETATRLLDATMDLDAYVWDHPDLLVVFAAGNSGPDDNTVGNPATAKNCLAVAASLNGPASGALASFSSRGPTNDGRIKPEVAFPGQGVTSAASDGDVSAPSCETRSLSGTSMATPGVAGMALLVRQYFVDGYYPDGAPDPARSLAPSAALVKAVLVHSAAPMEDELDPIPSTGQGWGRVLLADALPLSGSARALYIDDGRQLAEPDEEATWQVELPFDAERLKLTLAWSDWPSSPEATVHLVHDLDLVVTAPDGTTYLGNAFTGGVSDPTVADADRLNNLEQVLVPEPAAGTWTITARAHALPMAAQPFALVMTGSLGAVTPPADPDPPDTGDTADTSDTAPAHTGDTARETGEPDSESEDTAPLDSDPDPIDSAPPRSARAGHRDRQGRLRLRRHTTGRRAGRRARPVRDGAAPTHYPSRPP